MIAWKVGSTTTARLHLPHHLAFLVFNSRTNALNVRMNGKMHLLLTPRGSEGGRDDRSLPTYPGINANAIAVSACNQPASVSAGTPRRWRSCHGPTTTARLHLPHHLAFFGSASAGIILAIQSSRPITEWPTLSKRLVVRRRRRLLLTPRGSTPTDPSSRPTCRRRLSWNG